MPHPLAGAANTDSQQGIVFRQDARYTYSASANNIANSSSENIQGTMYFKTTALTYTGNPVATYSAIIADTLSIPGSATITRDPAYPVVSANPLPKALWERPSKFANESSCQRKPAACRWPDGFVWPRCVHRRAFSLLKQPDKQEQDSTGQYTGLSQPTVSPIQ